MNKTTNSVCHTTVSLGKSGTEQRICSYLVVQLTLSKIKLYIITVKPAPEDDGVFSGVFILMAHLLAYLDKQVSLQNCYSKMKLFYCPVETRN